MSFAKKRQEKLQLLEKVSGITHNAVKNGLFKKPEDVYLGYSGAVIVSFGEREGVRYLLKLYGVPQWPNVFAVMPVKCVGLEWGDEQWPLFGEHKITRAQSAEALEEVLVEAAEAFEKLPETPKSKKTLGERLGKVWPTYGRSRDQAISCEREVQTVFDLLKANNPGVDWTGTRVTRSALGSVKLELGMLDNDRKFIEVNHTLSAKSYFLVAHTHHGTSFFAELWKVWQDQEHLTAFMHAKKERLADALQVVVEQIKKSQGRDGIRGVHVAKM